MNAADALHAQGMKPRLQIERHLETEELVIWRHRGVSGRLVLSFSGIGSQNLAVPHYEFARIATGDGKHNALFIIDPLRTWLNGEGLIERIVTVVEAYAAEVGAEVIVTIGHSMGGFSAIVLTRFLPVKSAVALSPQYSVHPDIVGDDPRWRQYRRRIRTHRIDHVAEYMVPATSYHVFHGGQKVERPHRNRFPVAKNLYHTVLPGFAHQIPQKLKSLGLLEKVARSAMHDQPRKVRLALEPLGAHRRDLERYPAMPPSAELAS